MLMTNDFSLIIILQSVTNPNLPCMSPDHPASQPPVSRLMLVWESSPLGRPDPPTPAAPRGDLAGPNDLPGRMREDGRGNREQRCRGKKIWMQGRGEERGRREDADGKWEER